MNARRFASFEASLASRTDIGAEISFLVAAIEPPRRTAVRLLPVAVGCTVVLCSAGQALADQAQHVVVAGESLYRIAQRDLGSANRWQEIARLNHLVDPARIQIGQVLEMPGPIKRPLSLRIHHRSGSSRTTVDVQIVPAGVIVAKLPGRSTPRVLQSTTRLVPSIAISHNHKARKDRLLLWETADGVALLFGSLVTLRLLALQKRRNRRRLRPARPAFEPILHEAEAPHLESVAPAGLGGATEFWSYVPGSADLLAFMASCS